MHIVRVWLASALLILASVAWGECLQFYPKNTKIAVPGTVELCNTFYVSLYNTATKGVVITSHVVRAEDPKVARHATFVEDARIPNDKRASTSDYTNSGYDRGHMVPAGDAITTAELIDTFLLSNIAPQRAKLNRRVWRQLEQDIRTAATASKKNIVVVTGAVYPPAESVTTIGPGHIPVPFAFFKVVYYPSGIRCFYATNTNDSKVFMSSVEYIEQMASIKLPR